MRKSDVLVDLSGAAFLCGLTPLVIGYHVRQRNLKIAKKRPNRFRLMDVLAFAAKRADKPYRDGRRQQNVSGLLRLYRGDA